jgi:hypothetical protein
MSCTTMSNGAPQEFQNYTPMQHFATMTPPSIPLAFPITEDGGGGSEKRGRGQEGGHQPQQHQHTRTGHLNSNQVPNQLGEASHEVPLPESSSKRSRSNNYEAPRTVRPSILTAMGSLAGGSNPQTTDARGSFGRGPNSASVPLRRQLSIGALDPFIGGHDNMETETNDASRPRSMSF